MSDQFEAADFFEVFRARGEAIAEACTRCGDCFRACPMTEPAGIGDADPNATTGAIIDLLTGGDRDMRTWSGDVRVAAQVMIRDRIMPRRYAVIASEPVAPIVPAPALLGKT